MTILFQARRPPVLSVPSVVFASSLLVALKIAGLLMMRWGCRLGDRHSYSSMKWPPMALAVTARDVQMGC